MNLPTIPVLTVTYTHIRVDRAEKIINNLTNDNSSISCVARYDTARLLDDLIAYIETTTDGYDIQDYVETMFIEAEE